MVQEPGHCNWEDLLGQGPRTQPQDTAMEWGGTAQGQRDISFLPVLKMWGRVNGLSFADLNPSKFAEAQQSYKAVNLLSYGMASRGFPHHSLLAPNKAQKKRECQYLLFLLLLMKPSCVSSIRALRLSHCDAAPPNGSPSTRKKGKTSQEKKGQEQQAL